MKKTIIKYLRHSLKMMGIVLILSVILRVFVFVSSYVPSSSMDPVLLPGDYIIVSKLAYGARLYKSLKMLKDCRFNTFRTKGFGKVKRNDVIVFNNPYSGGSRICPDLNVYYVKRCVALPGDTFYIEKGMYKIRGSSETVGDYQAQQLLSVKRTGEPEVKPGVCFPQDSSHYHWTIKNFGPVYVPKKGDTLSIDSINYPLYKNLIEYETNQSLTPQDGKIYLDDQPVEQYIFQMNYYFMAGDRVLESYDSRYWGLLPEDHIIGKAVIIWQSKEKNSKYRRWNRTFKIIR